MKKSMLRTLNCRQPGLTEINLLIGASTFNPDGSSTAPTALGIDFAFVSSISRTSEGLYQITVKDKAYRDLIPVSIIPVSSSVVAKYMTSTETSIDIETRTIIAIAAAKAIIEIQDLTFEADTAGFAGDDISIVYTAGSSKSSLVVQDITYTMIARGIGGDSKQIEYLDTVLAGSEVATLVGNKISVAMEDGVSTATQIRAALLAVPTIVALMTFPITGTAGDAQDAVAATNLTGGGLVLASVVGTDITVGIESGVNTADDIKTAMDLVAGIAALVNITVTGTGSTAQVLQAVTNLVDGYDAHSAGDVVDASYYLKFLFSTANRVY